jgi:hypothetical protein
MYLFFFKLLFFFVCKIVRTKLGLAIGSCKKKINASTQSKRRFHGSLDEEDVMDDFDHVPIIKAICSGFFINTARRHPQRSSFYHYLVASGNLSSSDLSYLGGGGGGGNDSSTITPDQHDASTALLSLHIHPSSCLAIKNGDFSTASLSSSTSSWMATAPDWVVYQDLQFVTRVNMRVVSCIDFAWVEAGLERVKACQVAQLLGGSSSSSSSSVGGGEVDMVSNGGEKRDRKRALEMDDEVEVVASAGRQIERGIMAAADSGGDDVKGADKDKERQDKIHAAKLRFLARREKIN